MPLLKCQICGEYFDWKTTSYTGIWIDDIDNPNADPWPPKKIHLHNQCMDNIPCCSGPCGRTHKEVINDEDRLPVRYTCDPVFEYTCNDCVYASEEVITCIYCKIKYTTLCDTDIFTLPKSGISVCEYCTMVKCMICKDKFLFTNPFIIINAEHRNVVCLSCHERVSKMKPQTFDDAYADT